MVRISHLVMAMIVGLSSVPVYANSNHATWTQRVLKPVIRKQCEQELKASRLWQASTFLMSESTKLATQSNICECVGTNALNDVSTKDIAQAVISEDVKKNVVRKAVINSLQACSKEVFK